MTKITDSMCMDLPAVRWNDALPIGNGTLGALCYGNIAHDTIVLNHENLWLPVYPDQEMPEMHHHLPVVRELCRAGKYQEAEVLWYTELKKTGCCDEWVNSFQPAAQIDICHTCEEPFKNYARTLDFSTGLATVGWQEGDRELKREAFVSRADRVVVLRLTSTGDPGADRITLKPRLAELEQRGVEGRGHEGEVFIDYTSSVEGEFSTLTGTYKTDASQFMIILRVIRKADEIVVLASVIAPSDATTADEETNRLAGLRTEFEELFGSHVVGHRSLYERVGFSLGDPSQLENRSNEELLLKTYSGDVPLAMYERMFNYSRYLFISSVGKLPPNLQGVWNGSWNPPWSCDYTMDENIQMNYWQALQGNFPESCHAFFDFFENQLDDWRENARKLFNCRGIHAPIKSTTHGNNFHVMKNWPWHFWHSTAGWLAQLWHEYYLFTNDDEFLRNRVIPLNTEIADFYEDFLMEEKGILQFNPSVSPENKPTGGDCKTTVNATIEIAVAKEVLRNLISACRLTGFHTERIEKWQSMIDRLPPYTTNKDGALKEWLHPDLEDNYNHRHQSHIYPVFPGFETTKRIDPELFEACRVAVEKRLVVGIVDQTSWSLGHMACIFARLGQGDRAEECLYNILRVLCGPNLFTYHNDYRSSGITWPSRGTRGDAGAFQIDADLCFSAAIMEMLLFSTPDYLELLPALPTKWREGLITGLRARGGFTIDLEWKDGTLAKAVIAADRDCAHRVIYGDKEQVIDLPSGVAMKVFF